VDQSLRHENKEKSLQLFFKQKRKTQLVTSSRYGDEKVK